MRSVFAGLAVGGITLVLGGAAGYSIAPRPEPVTAAAVGIVFVLIGTVGLLAVLVRGGPHV